MLKLRPYQKEAIEAVLSARRAGVRRQVVCLPTGAGKTVIFSELARLAKRPVLVLAHRSELLDQAREKLERALPHGTLISVEQGKHQADEAAKVTIASIRSLREPRLLRLLEAKRFGLIIYDECHHATAEDNQRVLRSLGVFDEGWQGTLLGFTATTLRGDGVGLDEVFERIVYKKSISDLISARYLVPLRGYRVQTTADLQQVSADAGDFSPEELSLAVDIDERNALVARTVQELARDRRTICFCVTIQHARHLARALNAVGVPAGIVHGQLKAEQRKKTLEDFRKGLLSAITNVGVLTEGFDDPEVSCIAMARPTRSEGLYMQCVGRGTRLAPGKQDCLVLDFVDLSRLSLVSLPSLAGLPPGLDLEGQSLTDAARALASVWDEHPGLEVEPGAITLAEIQERAASFNPLALGLSEDIQAISANRWESLGSRGLALHVYWGERAARKEQLSEILVTDIAHGKANARGKRWEVRLDSKAIERFSRLEDAVAAVDYEISQRGKSAAESAAPWARWRGQPPPEPLLDQLIHEGQKTRPKTHGEALRLLAYALHGPKRVQVRR